LSEFSLLPFSPPPPSPLPSILFLYPLCHSFSWPSQILVIASSCHPLSLSFCPSSRPSRCTQCHCSDYYLLTCLWRHRPCLLLPSVPSEVPASLCRSALPVGERAIHGAQIRDTHTHTHTLSLFLGSLFIDTHTHARTPSADSPPPSSSPLCCPWGEVGREARSSSHHIPSVRSSSVSSALFCQHYLWRKAVAAGALLP